METMIGVIGGSGIYEIDGLEGAAWQAIETPGASLRTRF